MPLAFWEHMIRAKEDARLQDWSAETDPALLGYSPPAVRRFFGLNGVYPKEPMWTFDRMGATRTPHPDVRMICIGGEHEDHYDPDFQIYNDVVVLDLDGSVEIYGYPEEVFPPTDFHTATLVGERVILIGRLGYPEGRQFEVTPVMALELNTYRIDPLASHGERPGWIFEHDAEFSHGVITIRGGRVREEKDGGHRTRWNFDDYAYEVGTGLWKRLTQRKWRQYLLHDEGGKAYMTLPRILPGCSPDDPPIELFPKDGPFLQIESAFPRGIPYDTVWEDDKRILVAGISVRIDMQASGIEIIVEGEMDTALADAIAEDIRSGIEDETGRKCVVVNFS